MAGAARFGILGPLEVVDGDGRPVDLGGRQPRTLLAVLLAAGGRSVPVDTIVDAIWGEDPPASATGTLHSYVSRLRRRLGDHATLVFDDAGYRLEVDPELVDHRRFQALVDAGREHLAARRLDAAAESLREADSLWRGPALAEFAAQDFAVGLAVRLEEQRVAALEERVGAELELGRHGALAGELSELVAAHPLREGLRGHLALALYRSGRQAEALRALADAGRTLREELGIEPGRPLRELEAAILAQDPALEYRPPPGVPGAAPAPAAAADAAPLPGRAEPGAGSTGGLVGREAELALLLAAFDEARRRASFVIVEGEPGIGKTRLAEELRRHAAAAGAVAVWGRSDESGAAPALWPWLAPLRALVAQSSDAVGSLGDLLSGTAPVAMGQATDIQFERFEAVAVLLERAGARAPVVVLLDDLQWADEASLELLAFLAGRLERGVVVAATMRHLEVGRNDAVTDALAAVARRDGSRRIRLRGLDAAGTAELLDATTSRSTTPDIAASIHERSEGNPFYAIELARLLLEEGDPSAEVPAGVRDVVQRRVARLPAGTVDLLGVAAVVGRDVEVGLLTRAAQLPIDECLDALEHAVVHRLLIEVPDRPSVYRFSHALVREVLLDDLSSLRRARLHLRVADAIDSGGAGVDEVEILADHLWRAAPVGVGARAARALKRAAEVAVRRVAYAAAEDLLTKAVQLQRTSSVTDDDLRVELDMIVSLMEVARARRYFQGAANHDLLERARELAERTGRRDVLYDVLWFEWSALATSCRAAEAVPLAQAFVELTAGDPDPAVQAMGHQVWGVRCWGAGRIAEAAASLDVALELFGAPPEGISGFEAEQRLVNRTFWIWMHAATGDLTPAEAFGHLDALIEQMPDRFAVASICGFAATTAAVLGEWEAVERYVQISSEANPSAQFAFWGGQVLMQRGIVEAWRGDCEAAVAVFREGKERYTGIGGRSAVASFEAILAAHLANHGHLAAARVAIEAARRELDEYDERWNESTVLLAEGTVATAEGRIADAEGAFSRAVAVAREQGAGAFAARAEKLAADPAAW